ncbi:hypothetical protein HW132_28145 [Brasilonema sp. CT11]|nr:hypothetical protein [Brasilonema sp. CT11]
MEIYAIAYFGRSPHLFLQVRLRKATDALLAYRSFGYAFTDRNLTKYELD